MVETIERLTASPPQEQGTANDEARLKLLPPNFTLQDVISICGSETARNILRATLSVTEDMKEISPAMRTINKQLGMIVNYDEPGNSAEQAAWYKRYGSAICGMRFTMPLDQATEFLYIHRRSFKLVQEGIQQSYGITTREESKEESKEERFTEVQDIVSLRREL